MGCRSQIGVTCTCERARCECEHGVVRRRARRTAQPRGVHGGHELRLRWRHRGVDFVPRQDFGAPAGPSLPADTLLGSRGIPAAATVPTTGWWRPRGLLAHATRALASPCASSGRHATILRAASAQSTRRCDRRSSTPPRSAFRSTCLWTRGRRPGAEMNEVGASISTGTRSLANRSSL